MKKCPFCAELIKREARVCRFCGRELSSSVQSSARVPSALAYASGRPKVYYYNSDAGEVGPYTLQDMIDFFEAGVIAPETPVRKTGETDWVAFDIHPEMKKQ